MLTTKFLYERWENIRYYDGGYIQVDIDHPLGWYIGYKSIGQKTLLLISSVDMGNIDSSKSISVFHGLRNDGKWTLSFELLRNEQEDVFVNLCCDIIEHSRSGKDENEALKLAIRRYMQWNMLLEHQKKALLDESRRKGLIGELLFLQSKISQYGSAITAVQGWVGPDGSDRDFEYTLTWHEIKTIGVGANSVTISSLEQLDCNETGELVVYRVDKCAPEKAGAFSLIDMVKKTGDIIGEDPDAQKLFETKIARYGYIELPEYSEQKYALSGTQTYIVDETFPRIIKQSVSVQITAAQYVIDLPGIDGWKKQI